MYAGKYMNNYGTPAAGGMGQVNTTLQYTTVHSSTLQYTTVHYSTVQYTTVHGDVQIVHPIIFELIFVYKTSSID